MYKKLDYTLVILLRCVSIYVECILWKAYFIGSGQQDPPAGQPVDPSAGQPAPPAGQPQNPAPSTPQEPPAPPPQPVDNHMLPEWEKGKIIPSTYDLTKRIESSTKCIFLDSPFAEAEEDKFHSYLHGVLQVSHRVLVGNNKPALGAVDLRVDADFFVTKMSWVATNVTKVMQEGAFWQLENSDYLDKQATNFGGLVGLFYYHTGAAMKALAEIKVNFAKVDGLDMIPSVLECEGTLDFDRDLSKYADDELSIAVAADACGVVYLYSDLRV